jgi:glycerol-3-phosphate dehydrogenase
MGMRRDLSSFLDTTFDLLVIGAGIQGASIAWDACLRGLSVAVVDRGDFGGATSANSLGIVHGGLRYLARGDLPRMVESIQERSAFLRIAPELVEPLPVLVPTYRDLVRSRLVLQPALLVNDLISARRNRGLRGDRVIQRGRLVSRQECLRLFPCFRPEGLTGGALWYDARMRHPERLTLSFVRSAAERGAVPANYVRVDRLLMRDRRAEGALVTDLNQGIQFEVRARVVVVAAGPWTSELLASTLEPDPGTARAARALAVNVRIDRPLSPVAVGVQARSGPDDDPVCGGNRFLFAVPYNGSTLLGTWYAVDRGQDSRSLIAHGVRQLVREFKQACSKLELSATQVAGYQWGWLPLKGANERGRATALAERYRIIDHAKSDNVRHLLSVEGVKYTTARKVAERVVDWVFHALGRSSPPCRTEDVPLDISGGDAVTRTDGHLVRADVQRAVHEEMALKLSDIVLRRTTLGTASLSRRVLAETAQLAAAELGWDAMRQEAEIDEVLQQRELLHEAPVA